MRTGKDLILATKPFATENRMLSWLYTISTLTLVVFSIMVTTLFLPLIVRLAFSIISGLLLVRMFVIYHDHQHNAILHKSAVGNMIMKAFGMYILAPVSIWKRSHDFHHKHNSKLYVSDVGSFPTVTKSQFENFSNRQKFRYLAARHPINILFGYLTIFLYSFSIHSLIHSTKKHWDCAIALLLHFALAAILLSHGGLSAFFLTLFIPHFIACGIGSYLFYVQHNFPGAKFKIGADWKYDHAAIASTSYFKMNPVMQWFTGNIGYHHVHHINSRIPFYRLPQAMDALPELQETTVTSFKLRNIVDCLNLKVWDPDTNTMIGLKDLKD